MMIVNSNHECIAFDKVIHMSVVSEGISRNFSAIILAKMVNGDDKVISRYTSDNAAIDDFNRIMKAYDGNKQVYYTKDDGKA